MVHNQTSNFIPVTNRRSKTTHRVLHDSGFKLIPTPGDGHCFIHAFLLSWAVQIILKKCPSFEDVRSSIFLECVSNRNLYTPFTCGDISTFTKATKRYLLQGIFDSDFCDIVPLICANVFGVNIVILNENAWHVNDIEICPMSGRSCNTIYVHKYKDHYSGLNLTGITKQTNTMKNTVSTSNRFSVLESSDSQDSYDTSFPSLSKEVEKKSKYEYKKKNYATKNVVKVTAKHTPCPPEAIIIGTSQVRNLGSALNKLKIRAISYTNAGCQITHLVNRLKDMIPNNYMGKVIIQVGGNDCDAVDSEQTIGRFEGLIKIIQDIAPKCQFFVSEIPPRYQNRFTQYKIRTVNDFLHHTSLFHPNINFINSPDYVQNTHFKMDGVHLNEKGFTLFAQNLYKQVFQLVNTVQDLT